MSCQVLNESVRASCTLATIQVAKQDSWPLQDSWKHCMGLHQVRTQLIILKLQGLHLSQTNCWGIFPSKHAAFLCPGATEKICSSISELHQDLPAFLPSFESRLCFSELVECHGSTCATHTALAQVRFPSSKLSPDSLDSQLPPGFIMHRGTASGTTQPAPCSSTSEHRWLPSLFSQAACQCQRSLHNVICYLPVCTQARILDFFFPSRQRGGRTLPLSAHFVQPPIASEITISGCSSSPCKPCYIVFEVLWQSVCQNRGTV